MIKRAGRGLCIKSGRKSKETRCFLLLILFVGKLRVTFYLMILKNPFGR